MEESKNREILRNSASGYLALVVLLGLLVTAVWFFYMMVTRESAILLFTTVVPTVILFVLGLVGLFMVHPNQARVLTLFGKYVEIFISSP